MASRAVSRSKSDDPGDTGHNDRAIPRPWPILGIEQLVGTRIHLVRPDEVQSLQPLVGQEGHGPFGHLFRGRPSAYGVNANGPT